MHRLFNQGREGYEDWHAAKFTMLSVRSESGYTLAELIQQMRGNLLGVWRTDRALLPQITAKRGYLLNIASPAAQVWLKTTSWMTRKPVRCRP